MKLSSFFANDAPRWVVVSIWVVVNGILFGVTFASYKDEEEYTYLRALVGNSLCWARASAACLNLNVMLVLLPVCRKLFSFLRTGCCLWCPRSVRRLMDKNITYHRYIAYMISFLTAIHISAHCFNFERLAEARRANGADIRNYLSLLPTSPNGTWINPIRTSDPDPTREVFKTVAGISGIVITICLLIIVSSSTDMIRRSNFEVFWFTHHVFIIFFVGFVVHGVQMIIRKQTNLKVHPPAECIERFGKANQCTTEPHFEGSAPSSWKWVVAPIAIYLIERLFRFYSSWQLVVITKVVNHPSQVFELRMQKKGFSASPGQYVLIQCPAISRFEWHPFTLTSAPNDEFFSVHIRRAGDWTNCLAKLCRVDEDQFEEAWKMPKLYVDGPLGTATEDALAYDVAVFIGCGIGITPFASVLKSIWYKLCHPKDDVSLERVYVYWICPKMDAFEWFSDLLVDLERQMRQRNTPDFLHCNIYLTRGWNANQARNIVLHDDASDYDAITGLRQKTQYGRPHWENVFKDLSLSHIGKKTGVFFCGPSQLSGTLHKLCTSYSNTDTSTAFVYNKENF